jgi:hypothetical protein
MSSLRVILAQKLLLTPLESTSSSNRCSRNPFPLARAVEVGRGVIPQVDARVAEEVQEEEEVPEDPFQTGWILIDNLSVQFRVTFRGESFWERHFRFSLYSSHHTAFNADEWHKLRREHAWIHT